MKAKPSPHLTNRISHLNHWLPSGFSNGVNDGFVNDGFVNDGFVSDGFNAAKKRMHHLMEN
jgi:hypothetical protein